MTQHNDHTVTVQEGNTTRSTTLGFGIGWQASPSQISFFALMQALKANTEAARAYAENVQHMWNPENRNTMLQMILQEYEDAKKAGKEQAWATRMQGIQQAVGAGISVASAVTQFVGSRDSIKKAEQNVDTATKNRDSVQKVIQEAETNNKFDQGAGNPGAVEQRRDAARDVDNLQTSGAFQKKDGVIQDATDQVTNNKTAIETAGRKRADKLLDHANEQLKTAETDRSNAYMQRQALTQRLEAVYQALQSISGAATKVVEADFQNKAADKQADAKIAEAGQNIYNSLTGKISDNERSSFDNARQILQELLQMLRSNA